ncbi:hypothetical protein, partial [Nocardia macrotermitis]|uniref:hypothetical protein n=1 Tax=Nocardia macrotermitis TaxID=2585198 RepID=UPI0012969ACB
MDYTLDPAASSSSAPEDWQSTFEEIDRHVQAAPNTTTLDLTEFGLGTPDTETTNTPEPTTSQLPVHPTIRISGDAMRTAAEYAVKLYAQGETVTDEIIAEAAGTNANAVRQTLARLTEKVGAETRGGHGGNQRAPLIEKLVKDKWITTANNGITEAHIKAVERRTQGNDGSIAPDVPDNTPTPTGEQSDDRPTTQMAIHPTRLMYAQYAAARYADTGSTTDRDIASDITKDGRPTSERTVNQTLNRLSKQAGITNRKPRSGRGELVEKLVENGSLTPSKKLTKEHIDKIRKRTELNNPNAPPLNNPTDAPAPTASRTHDNSKPKIELGPVTGVYLVHAAAQYADTGNTTDKEIANAAKNSPNPYCKIPGANTNAVTLSLWAVTKGLRLTKTTAQRGRGELVEQVVSDGLITPVDGVLTQAQINKILARADLRRGSATHTTTQTRTIPRTGNPTHGDGSHPRTPTTHTDSDSMDLNPPENTNTTPPAHQAHGFEILKNPQELAHKLDENGLPLGTRIYQITPNGSI